MTITPPPSPPLLTTCFYIKSLITTELNEIKDKLKTDLTIYIQSLGIVLPVEYKQFYV